MADWQSNKAWAWVTQFGERVKSKASSLSRRSERGAGKERARSLAGQLTGWALLLGAVPLVVILVAGHFVLNAYENARVRDFKDAASVAASALDQELGRHYADVKEVASLGIPGEPIHWYQPGESNPVVALLNQRVALNKHTVLSYVVDLEGRLIAVNSKGPDGAPLATSALYDKDFSTAEWFQHLKAGDYTRPHANSDRAPSTLTGAYVEDVSVDENATDVVGGSPFFVLGVSAPVYVNGQILGFWSNRVSYEGLQHNIEHLASEFHDSLGGSPTITVVNAAGVVQMAYDKQRFGGSGFGNDPALLAQHNEIEAGNKAFAVLREKSRSGGFFYDRSRKQETVAGGATLRGNAHSPGLGWSVVVQRPKSEVFASTAAYRWQGVVGALAALSILGAFAYFLARRFVKPIEKLTESILPFTRGDFNTQVFDEGPGEVKRLGGVLDTVADEVSMVLRNVKQSADELLGASSEIFGASQSLADNASNSACAIEQISASIANMSSQTQHNARNAAEAMQLSERLSKSALEGNNKMEEMVAAMGDISLSSDRIAKIIQVIDEIAFQTNLLALNAAVEAARAGAHGKGFAVVAEEVRTLAARSAKAASETTALIEDSLFKVGQGTEIARRTAESLEDIVQGIGQVSGLMREVSSASGEQASGISEINLGLQQVDNGVQTNTASAEELSAAARELTQRANDLEENIRSIQFRSASGAPGGRDSMAFAAGAEIGVDGFSAADFGVGDFGGAHDVGFGDADNEDVDYLAF